MNAAFELVMNDRVFRIVFHIRRIPLSSVVLDGKNASGLSVWPDSDDRTAALR